MTKQFRMIAGPNGSGKSTLAVRLTCDYAVNFYTMLNADDMFAQAKRSKAILAPFPIDGERLVAYAERTDYAEAEKAHFQSSEITVASDCIRFSGDESVNSYTVALIVNFLQDEFINRGISFSQETVFSHPSKIEALKKAHAAGFRTYLYYVATADAGINVDRVARRHALGGHDVPTEKIYARYVRSLENVQEALPCLSRAFFFDNSGDEMLYIASFSKENGFQTHVPNLPHWFKNYIFAGKNDV